MDHRKLCSLKERVSLILKPKAYQYHRWEQVFYLLLDELSAALQSFVWCEVVEDCWSDIFNFFGRAHANGSIRRGHKNEATDAVTMRTGLGINLKEVKVFNRAREKGWLFLRIILFQYRLVVLFMYIKTYKKLNTHWFMATNFIISPFFLRIFFLAKIYLLWKYIEKFLVKPWEHLKEKVWNQNTSYHSFFVFFSWKHPSLRNEVDFELCFREQQSQAASNFFWKAVHFFTARKISVSQIFISWDSLVLSPAFLCGNSCK